MTPRLRFAAPLLTLSLLFSLRSVANAQDTAPTGLPEAAREKVSAFVREQMAKQKIPGLSLAVVTDRQVRWAQGFGLADVENDVPVTPKTMFRLASVSKTLTAVAAMRLVEQGKLDLDAPVQKYVPSFPAKAWPVTARHLLAHTSGVRHYKLGETNSTRLYLTLESALDIFKGDALLHEPGAKYTYTTYGYTLLGRAIEAASGRTFLETMREDVFKPANMAAIRDDSVQDLIPHRATGYARNPSGPLRNSGLADTSYKIPGGGFVATAEDLARFAVALQSGRLLRPETLRAMWTEQKTKDGKGTGYGLGWDVGAWQGRPWAAHSGGQQKVSTYFYMQPEHGLAVVVLTNLERANAGEIARGVANILLPPQAP